MQCPDCGYMLTAFDNECPRCEKFGKPRNPVSAGAPTSADWPAGRDGSPMAAHETGRGAGTGVMVVVLVVVLVLLGIVLSFTLLRSSAPESTMKSGARTNQSRLTGSPGTAKAIIAAAKEATYRRYGIRGSALSRQSWEKQLSRCSASITLRGNKRAEVKFFMKSGALLDKEAVQRNRSGKWLPAATL